MAIHRFREDSTLECVECNERWPVFLDDRFRFEIVGRHDYRRVETFLGTGERLVGGRNSQADFLASKKIEHRWSRRVDLRSEQVSISTTAAELKTTVGLPGVGDIVAGLQHRFEKTTKEELSVSEKTETTISRRSPTLR